MNRFAIIAAAALWFGCSGAEAQDIVHFPALEDKGAGQPPTVLDGYLFRPAEEGRHPAIVGLHGCSGMFRPRSSEMLPSLFAWADELNRRGYVVLLVDSFGPRRHGEMCSPGFQPFSRTFRGPGITPRGSLRARRPAA